MNIGAGGLISLGGGSSSNSGSSSGIQSLNSQTGPSVLIAGVNGISVSSPASNFILIDASSLSGIKYAANFTNITSGAFQHNFNTLDVLVQIRDLGQAGYAPETLIPDKIIFDNLNQISIIFNTPQTGRVIIKP